MSTSKPTSYARCDGSVFTDGATHPCQQRDTCSRYVEFTINNKPAVRLWVALQPGDDCRWYDKQEANQ